MGKDGKKIQKEQGSFGCCWDKSAANDTYAIWPCILVTEKKNFFFLAARTLHHVKRLYTWVLKWASYPQWHSSNAATLPSQLSITHFRLLNGLFLLSSSEASTYICAHLTISPMESNSTPVCATMTPNPWNANLVPLRGSNLFLNYLQDTFTWMSVRNSNPKCLKFLTPACPCDLISNTGSSHSGSSKC